MPAWSRTWGSDHATPNFVRGAPQTSSPNKCECGQYACRAAPAPLVDDAAVRLHRKLAPPVPPLVREDHQRPPDAPREVRHGVGHVRTMRGGGPAWRGAVISALSESITKSPPSYSDPSTKFTEMDASQPSQWKGNRGLEVVEYLRTKALTARGMTPKICEAGASNLAHSLPSRAVP